MVHLKWLDAWIAAGQGRGTSGFSLKCGRPMSGGADCVKARRTHSFGGLNKSWVSSA